MIGTSSSWDDAAAADPAAPVLVLRALGLGDGLAAVAALRGLRRALPGRLLVLACAHPVARLLNAHGLVDTVLPASGLDGAPPGLALGRHLAVNLHGCGPQSSRLLLDGRASAVLAFGNAEAGVPGPAWDVTEHEVSRWCRLVGEIGGACDESDLRLSPIRGNSVAGQADTDPLSGAVVIHPGAAAPARCWPAPRWAAVAAALEAAGRRVVVTGSDAERHLAEDVADDAGLPPAAVLAGALTLDQLAALVSRSGLVLCGDTGVAHLATAYGTPSVVLFGPTPPSLWGPAVDSDLHRVIWHGDGFGDPHASTADPALLRITVDEVLSAAEAMDRQTLGVTA